METRVEKVGGIWHGTINGHPEVDVRGLTEEIARRKVERVAEDLDEIDDGSACFSSLPVHLPLTRVIERDETW
jgi:hypothetical protein